MRLWWWRFKSRLPPFGKVMEVLIGTTVILVCGGIGTAAIVQHNNEPPAAAGGAVRGGIDGGWYEIQPPPGAPEDMVCWLWTRPGSGVHATGGPVCFMEE